MTDPPRARVVPADALRPPGSRTLRFEGRDHGSGISFYLVTNDAGQGPGLHRHPYTETWTVLEGTATIFMGEEQVVARAGDTAVVQPGTWHGFTNTGDGVLRIMCIHASPVFVQEDHVLPA
ncbi:cupin domain-containing protein [Cellulomonas sp. ATA003]|uniref:cupin domain-containing protein n=1 Tax=Cellulomonas sp. ATA003 TaxID=3073064 RepID=UPI0028732BE5|nr:cupin domain-containing protein [Cellulomonas sp. ATA003]WNB86254.1 cupin domain-containing protein [Cellulomonas sp. ATA003]